MEFQPDLCVCDPFIFNQTQPAGGTCHGPGQLQLLGLWAIPSTESGPQPPLVTYNPSPLYVCMGCRGSMQVW